MDALLRPPTLAEKDHFTRADLGSGLRGRASRGAALTLGGQWFRFGLQLAGTIVLARILVPRDYGIYGMVIAFTGLAEQLKDLGLSSATVQRKDITHEQVSTLFWVNTALGVCLALLLVALAPSVATFYDRPELTAVTAVLASAFVAGGLTVQHHALLMRQMRFGWLVAEDVVSMLAGIAVGIAAALAGAGYWALVASQLAAAFARLVLVWTACRWRPSLPRRGTEIRPLLAFGGHLSVFNILTYLSRNLDNVLVGRFAGPVQLGLYSRAYQTLLIPIQQINGPITSVAVPTLSALQGDPERYRRYYRSALGVIGYLAIPLIVMLAVVSEEVVVIALGNQWAGAAPIFQVLAFAGIARILSNANGWIYISTGQTKRMALWAIISRPLIVLSFVIGVVVNGAYGVAVAYSVCAYLLVIPGFSMAMKGSPLRLSDVLGATRRPLTVGIILYVVATVAHQRFEGLGMFSSLAATSLVGVGTMALSVLLWSNARDEVTELARVMRVSLSQRKKHNV